MTLKQIFLFFVSVFFSIGSFAGDLIRMKNGDVYRGEIIEQQMNKFVQIKFKDGNEKRLDWKDIESITKDQPPTPEQVNQSDGKTLTRSGEIGRNLWMATYAGTAAYVLTRNNGNTSALLPVIGPVVAINDNYTSSDKTLSIVSTALQTVGMAMWIGGYEQNSNKQSTFYYFYNESLGLSFNYNF